MIDRLKIVPLWIWLIVACGALLTILGGFFDGYAQGLCLSFGVAFLLALPISLIEQSLDASLARAADRIVASVAEAAAFRLTASRNGEVVDALEFGVPATAEDLELWPFVATTACRQGKVALELRTSKAASNVNQPLDVMLVVTDPSGMTFTRERRLNAIISVPVVACWEWPGDFTSASSMPAGVHSATFFVAPLSVGPSRRFGKVAEASFVFPRSSDVGAARGE